MALWSLLEALVWPIIPDFLLATLVIGRPRRAGSALAACVGGSAIGTAILYAVTLARPADVMRLLLRLPFVFRGGYRVGRWANQARRYHRVCLAADKRHSIQSVDGCGRGERSQGSGCPAYPDGVTRGAHGPDCDPCGSRWIAIHPEHSRTLSAVASVLRLCLHGWLGQIDAPCVVSATPEPVVPKGR